MGSTLANVGLGAERLSWGWRDRTEPLAPVAVAGVNAVGLRLARRLLDEPEERLTRLQAAGGTAECFLMVIASDADTLPWVDGSEYLGRDTAAPALLLPTNRVPAIPLPLLELGLRAQVPELAPPLAVLPIHNDLRVLSVAEVRPVSRRVLQAWLKAWEAASHVEGFA